MTNNHLRLFILIDCLFISINCIAQSLVETKEFEPQLESLITTANLEERDIENSVDELVNSMDKRIDLNSCDAQVLTALFILSPAQIKALLEYRQRVGKFKSVYELQFIYALDRETLNQLKPFVFVLEESTKPVDKLDLARLSVRQEFSSKVLLPLYKRAGDKNQYLGPSVYNNIRYKCQLGQHIEFGLTGEKDLGEPLFALNNSWGYDFYSYYLSLKNIYNIEKLCLGLYRVGFGLGLTVGLTNFDSKWSAIQSFFKSGSTLQNHASVSEYNFFRGIASIYNMGKFELTTFLSYNLIDAAIEEGEIKTIYRTGLHRTSKEFRTKNSAHNLTLGQRISYEGNQLKLGLNGVYYQFEHPIANSSLKYKKYDLWGNKFYNLSLDYTLFLKKFILKGEVAKGKRGVALLNKLYYSPSTNWDFLLIHRFYSYDYWGYFASAFGNQSSVKNENGWYLGMQTTSAANMKINAYLDFASYPWYRYRVSKASQSVDFGVAGELALPSSQRVSFRVSHRQTLRDLVGKTTSKAKIQTPFGLSKLHLEYLGEFFDEHFKVKSMAEGVYAKTNIKELGYALTQRMTFSTTHLSCTLQYSYFDTPSFDSRIYIYENNFLYSWGMNSFEGCGQRCSCLFHCKLNNSISLSMKYGITHYFDRNSIGTGMEQIAQHKKEDISLMGRFKF